MSSTSNGGHTVTVSKIDLERSLEEYEPWIRAYCARRVEPDAVDDVVHDTIVAARERPEPMPDGHPLLPWLYGIAHRVAQLRRYAIGPATRAEATDRVLAASMQLDEPGREILWLSAWEALSVDDVSVVLDLPPDAVRRELDRAGTRLAAELGRSDRTATAWARPPGDPGDVIGRRDDAIGAPHGDDVVAVLAEANPVSIIGRPAGSSQHVRSIVDLDRGIAGDDDADETPPRGRARWPLLVTACAVLVVASIVAMSAGGPDAVDDAAPSPPATLRIPELLPPLSVEIELAERFITAVNARDLASIARAGADELTLDGGNFDDTRLDDLSLLLDWHDALGWRWDDVRCEAWDHWYPVTCDVVERNRLTEFSGGERPARIFFMIDDDEITWVGVASETANYRMSAFLPFVRWTREHHPADVEHLWIATGLSYEQVVSVESIELLDRFVTEYTSTRAATAAAPTPTAAGTS